MKFLTKKNFHQHSPIQVQDYIDINVIESLSIEQQNLLEKIIYADSKYLEKFFNKLSSNQVFLNSDMLSKILDKLTCQMSLPLKIIEQENKNANLNIFSLDEPFSDIHLDIWFDLLEKLNFWSNIPLENISEYLRLAHFYIAQDIFPPFSERKPQSSKLFWQKKTNAESIYTEIIFKFIYNKFKHFHWEYIPNTKRPMDLFELFCPLEDTALEKNILVLNEDHSDFLRSLNASALIYSVVFSFPAALPDFIAQAEDCSCPLWDKIQQDHQYEPMYGQHPYLHNLNRNGFYHTLNNLLNQKRNPIEFLHELATSQTVLEEIEHFYTSQSNRLIFIFNRLTSLGFLMRSPLLKGLGFHPVINTETPTKFINNLKLFLNYFKALDQEQKENYIKLQQTHEEYPNMKMV